MQSTGPIPQPDPAGPGRGRLGRRPSDEVHLLPAEHRIADVLQRVVDERLQEAMRAIEERSAEMMREVAAEMWRSGGGDVRPEQERIIALISRDQALRSLIASSDERFQSLAVRTARLEDSLRDLAETGRSTRKAMEASADAVREIAGSPTLQGVDLVRAQLEQVERHIAETLAHLNQHDQALSEGVLKQVREHGELIARETTRVVEAMQGYVQSGTEAMGRLAQRVEAHAEAFADKDLETPIEPLREQVQMLDERMGIHGRSLREVQQAMERLVEARVIGLAQLLRADSEALRELIERRNDEQGGATRAVIDERMEQIGAAIGSRFGSLADETVDGLATLAASVRGSIDEGFREMGLHLAHLDGLDVAMAEGQSAVQERLMAHVDSRIAAVAKLIRSDNRALAASLREGPDEREIVKQVLRSVKEMQAGIASDVLGSIDRRFQAISDQLHHESQDGAHAMMKVAEMLGSKIDRLSAKVDEGRDGDLQIVVDRVSDAIRTISSGRQPRSELG